MEAWDWFGDPWCMISNSTQSLVWHSEIGAKETYLISVQILLAENCDLASKPQKPQNSQNLSMSLIWAGLLWNNDARLADCRCSTKSRVALHIASPWKPNWSPSHHVSDAPMTNSSPWWPPEPSTEAPSSSQKPSGIETHYPWKWWRPQPMTLSCQGYQTEQLPTVFPHPSSTPIPDFAPRSPHLSRPVQQRTPPVIGARIIDTLIVGP